MDQTILTHRYENGLVLLAEPMDWLESAAFAILLPSGCSRDPADRLGLSSFTGEMVQRGCGPRDSRQFVADLELLGLDHGSSVSNAHTSFGGALPAENLYDALAIYADLLRRPHLPPEQLEEARLVCLQEVRAIDDDLAQRVMIELRRRCYPEPFGRACHGTLETVSAVTLDDVRNYFNANYRPNEAILSVAGNVDWPRLRDCVGELLGDWPSSELPLLKAIDAEGGSRHIGHESSQTHIGVAYPSVPYSHPNYFQARGAVGVLSDGMSSRLFTEVREKRGLCYSVSASMHFLRDRGSVVCYVGTSTDRAQQSLDVLIGELLRLSEGIEPEELDRLKVQVRSGLVMQQESSRSRAAVIAGDWYHLGRVRSMDEVQQIINDLTVEGINAYLRANPPSDFCVVTLGQQPLEMPGAVLPA